MAKQNEKIKASTQEHLDIEDICDDLVIMKSGWVSMVMSTTAVNFDILSEAEQDATIYAFGALLNSLTFPLQVLIRSKKADITAYYQHLVEAEQNQPNPDLRIQIKKYREFIQSTVQQKTILDKRFYLIIHFSPLELGMKSFKKTNAQNAKSKGELIAEAKAALAPKREHLVKQTARLGLFTKQMTTQELIELFYDIYNPAPTGTQRVILDAASYTTPLVEPALEVPTPAPVVVPAAQAPVVDAAGLVLDQASSAQVVTPPTIAAAAPTNAPVLSGLEAPILGNINNSLSGQEQSSSGLVAPQPVINIVNNDAAISSENNRQQGAVDELQEAMRRASEMASGRSGAKV